MRPLFHPSIDDITVEGILHALSDPVRVAIYTEIACAECTSNCTNFINIGTYPKAITPYEDIGCHG